MKIIDRYCALLICSLTLMMQSAAAEPLRVALVQSTISWGNVEENLSMFESKITTSAACDLFILPELFTSGCDMRKIDRETKIVEKHRVAAQYENIIERMQQWAKTSGAVVVGSTIYEESGDFYNRLLAVYPSGEYLHYDKHNCFKMGSFTAGEYHVVIDVKGYRFATYICYDLRFSEWSRCDGRYDCAIYIANWPTSRSTQWSALLKERAEENGAYVVGVNCVGVDLSGVEFMGDCSLFSPSGELIDRCKSNEEEILIVELTEKNIK